ncbi:addiction module component, TIGR02574 family (plasmid) [Gemmatirosa kalamazoonensis]|uniref:Addiction module component, TIGR02574 family n=1 Tax=Gemmatirosa kalamazoonensis TaxID=861299 RepID=W0RRD7_9BACT|nr:addiction module protein [Gemmatirosa kalamazoonensis]AHG92880.1 addiction module component, TIGR02574 family [Gemmatirosa kalamazoonensis]
MVRPAFDIAQLTVAERLELIEELWASLAARPDLLPLTPAQLALVAERRAEQERDPGSAVPWDVVRAELFADQEADERAAAERAAGREG